MACFDPSGAPADATFSLLYLKYPGTVGGGGAVIANQPTSASYTPALQTDGDHGCGPFRAGVVRSAAGAYSVSYPSTQALPGAPLVSSFGTGASYCKPTSWGGSGADANVSVTCFNSAGAAADASFVNLLINTATVPPC